MDARKLNIRRTHWTLILFSILIYFQQVFVINVQSSFKLYEILSILVCAYLIFRGVRYVQRRLMYFTFLFGLLPFVTIFFGHFIVTNEVIQMYYLRFPDAIGSLRFNYQISSKVLLFFYFITLGALIFIYKNNNKNNFQKIIKIFIISGSIVSIYALFSIVTVSILGLPDIIPDVVDNRNTRPENNIRPAGFSAEPGTFIYMLGWQLIFLLAFPQLFKRSWVRVSMIVITCITILMTLSSLIIMLFTSMVCAAVVSGYSWRKKVALVIGSFIGIMLVYVCVGLFLTNELRDYVIFGRVIEFVSLPSHTCGSGAFRSFTNYLGFSIFSDFPLGVGPGGSYFLMHLYEASAGITHYCEELSYTNSPQSSYVMVLSELGILGFISLVLLLSSYLFSFKRAVCDNHRVKHMALSGIIFTILSLSAIFPVYNIFIWYPLILMDRSLTEA